MSITAKISVPGVQGPAGVLWSTVNGGAWLTGTVYPRNAGVTRDGSSYRALVDHTAGAASEPSVGEDWGEFWQVLALGSSVAEVATVAGIAEEIATVAGEISAVVEAADNMAAILAAPDAAATATAKADEVVALVDSVVHVAVLDRDLTSPPVAPEDGDRYIVAAGATGAWDGRDGKIAARQDGAWIFLSPGTGWLAWVIDEGEFFHYTGSDWASVAGTIATLQNLALLGVGATADATNPFSAKLNKALWTAKPAGEGGDGDLRYSMNKEGAGNVLSLLMQSGWSGRAELGLIGDDDLSLKVSPDGASWTTALSIDKTTGATTIQGGSVEAPGLAVADAATGLYDAGGGYLGVAVSGTNVITLGGNNCLQVRRTGSAGVTPAFAGESNVIFDFARYSDNASSPVLRMYKARGTTAAPATVSQGDIGMELQANAYGASAFGLLSQLRFSVEAASPSNTDKKGRMTLLLNSGSGTTTEILRVEHATGLSMFGANPVVDQNRHHRLRSYTVGTLPSASPAAQMIYVSDGTSNKRLAVSDGTNWRFPDGSVVS